MCEALFEGNVRLCGQPQRLRKRRFSIQWVITTPNHQPYPLTTTQPAPDTLSHSPPYPGCARDLDRDGDQNRKCDRARDQNLTPRDVQIGTCWCWLLPLRHQFTALPRRDPGYPGGKKGTPPPTHNTMKPAGQASQAIGIHRCSRRVHVQPSGDGN